MRSLPVIFVFFVVFFSKIWAMQCVDNGLTEEQYLAITTSKNAIDADWEQLTVSTKNSRGIISTQEINNVNEKIRQYRDGRSYYSGGDIEVFNALYLYVEGLRVRWYQNCMNMK